MRLKIGIGLTALVTGIPMTEDAEQASPKCRFERENEELVRTYATVQGGVHEVMRLVARAKKGGNASYLASLGSGSLSMSDRGKLGGRPNELTLDQIGKRQS